MAVTELHTPRCQKTGSVLRLLSVALSVHRAARFPRPASKAPQSGKRETCGCGCAGAQRSGEPRVSDHGVVHSHATAVCTLTCRAFEKTCLRRRLSVLAREGSEIYTVARTIPSDSKGGESPGSEKKSSLHQGNPRGDEPSFWLQCQRTLCPLWPHGV